MRYIGLPKLTLLLVFLLALPVPFLAQAPNDSALTNQDIVKMVKGGIPESIILREIQMSGGQLVTNAAALIELKKHGASERILDAVLDSRFGTGQFTTEAPQVAGVTAQPGPHHLPTFEADMQFNANTKGKLKVGKNQIKVERSGVPLFSVKWKDNPR